MAVLETLTKCNDAVATTMMNGAEAGTVFPVHSVILEIPQTSHLLHHSSARAVGYAECPERAGNVLKAGVILLRNDGVGELSLVCVPFDGVLNLRFTEDIGFASRPLLMVVRDFSGDMSVEIGKVELRGFSGCAHFFANPVLDAKFIF